MTRYQFTVPGQPIPKGRPRVVGTNAFTPKRTREYERRVRDYAILAKVRPITGPVRLVLEIFFGDARCRDDDNVEKSIRDALQGRKKKGVWVVTPIGFENDRQICHVVKTVALDRANPRVEVTLASVEAGFGFGSGDLFAAAEGA